MIRTPTQLVQWCDKPAREQAEAIWDSAILKAVVGRSANADDLADISRLIGERDHREE